MIRYERTLPPSHPGALPTLEVELEPPTWGEGWEKVVREVGTPECKLISAEPWFREEK
jgi:hypothetical protein